MRRSVLFALAAVSAIDTYSALAQDVPTCVPACTNQLRGEFANFACASADDVACLCAAPNFFYGVRDCAPPCGATDLQVFNYLSDTFCQGKTIHVTPTATQPVATPSASVPTSPPGSSTTSPPTSASIESSAGSSSSTGTLSESAPPTSTLAPTASETITSSTAASSATSPESTVPTEALASVTAAPPTATPSSASSEDQALIASSSRSSLSQSAVIGIGVGVGVAVLALAAIAVFFLWRNRKRTSSHSIEISKSFPDNGRSYPNSDQGPFEKYANDIEMVSNRYEDMVPRTKPRTMV